MKLLKRVVVFLGLMFLSGCIAIKDPIVLTFVNTPPIKRDDQQPEPPGQADSAPLPTNPVAVSPGPSDKPVVAIAPVPSALAASAPTASIPDDFRKRPEVVAYVNEMLKAQKNCTGFKMPIIPAVPEISRQELEAIDKKDNKALNALLLKHVGQLYSYSTNWKTQVEESYNRYRRTCKQ